MPKQSSGILLYRIKDNRCQVLLVHPGGPIWSSKDLGAWSIPKGELAETEDPLHGAFREFQEETGITLTGKATPLLAVKQKSGKIVHAWAVEGDLDTAQIVSNLFELEWPPHSGKYRQFPEIDHASWFSLQEAASKINAAQISFLKELESLLDKDKK